MVTLGTEEPYRLFTSRAEYRLSLRHDTADLRLLEKGYQRGLQSQEALQALEAKRRGIEEIRELLRQRTLRESDCEDLPHLRKHLGRPLEHVLKDPQVRIEQLLNLALGPEQGKLTNPAWLRSSELDVKYEGYIRRQEKQVERFRRMEDLKIPPDFDYEAATGLCAESRLKFKEIRPQSIGQASRISGVRSSDIAVLLVYLGGGRRETG